MNWLKAIKISWTIDFKFVVLQFLDHLCGDNLKASAQTEIVKYTWEIIIF